MNAQTPTQPDQKPHYGISFTPIDAVYPLKGLKHEPHTIDWMWRLFNTLPKRRPQLLNSQNATRRLLQWRSKSILPPRAAYTSTVDYYEAAAPLFCARRRFNSFIEPDVLMRHVTQACKNILPKALF